MDSVAEKRKQIKFLKQEIKGLQIEIRIEERKERKVLLDKNYTHCRRCSNPVNTETFERKSGVCSLCTDKQVAANFGISLESLYWHKARLEQE